MREAAASIVVGSLESLRPTKDELRFFSKEKIPGFVLFKRNIPQEDHSLLTQQLIDPLHKAMNDKTPLFISVDQEGGRVSRLGSPFPNEGCAMRAHLHKSEQALFEYGKAVGTALLKLRINVNLAPVVDILSNPLNVGIGDRSFGLTADQVVERSANFLNGMQSVGVLGCLKHFPGQGSELSDTHLEKVVIHSSKDTLHNRELIPYKKLLPLTKMVLISHCIFPALDSKPASLSHTIISGLLRKELNFDGLVLSDDMNMKAISQDPKGWGQAIVAAVAAGSNLVLVCSKLENWIHAIEALEAEGRKSEAFANLLYASAEKVQTFRRNSLHA